MNIKIFVTMAVSLFLVSINLAQTDETWHLEERCLIQPETPPDDWTYSGTILTIGEQGIHGYNVNWDTRRVIAYRPNNLQLLPPISPDGRTWVTLQGDDWCTGSCFSTWRTIQSMTVHDLSSSTPQSYTLTWEFETGDNWRSSLEDRGVPILRWLSPTQFLYAKDLDGLGRGDAEVAVLFDTISREILPYNYSVRDFPLHRISPDGTLEVRSEFINVRERHNYLIDTRTQEIVTTLPDEMGFLHFSSIEAWSGDSQFFLAKIYSDNITNIVLVDREGQVAGSIVNIEDLFGDLDVDWSPNGRYLTVFLTSSFASPTPQLRVSYLIDLQDMQTYNLCLEPYINAAWSYDSTQLALQSTDILGNVSNITIFEPATWDWYIAEENSDTWLVGWQFPEE